MSAKKENGLVIENMLIIKSKSLMISKKMMNQLNKVLIKFK